MSLREKVRENAYANLALTLRVNDLYAGTGQGVIMLFSGEPGTGKTLTSESGTYVVVDCASAMTASRKSDRCV
jgi:hypothetical protein